MEAVNSLSKATEVQLPQTQKKSLPEKTVVKELVPDSFEPSAKKKVNITEATLAVAGAGVAASQIYKPAKGFLEKAVGFVEKEATAIINSAKGGAKNVAKTAAVYGGALAATATVFGIALRDKDGNGHIDLIDGIRKIVNP